MKSKKYCAGLTPGVYLALLACLFAAGAAVRLWALGSGLPYIFHPDENRQILDALGMAERGSLLPEDLSYPAMHKYMLIAVNGAYFAAGRLMGWFNGPVDFALEFLKGSTHVFYLSRLASVAAGLVLGLVSFKAASRVYSDRAGLVAFVYTLFMFHLVQHSRWAISDIFVALLTTASLYYAAMAAREPNEGRHTTMALLWAGVTVATKPQGLFLLVPIALSQAFVYRDLRPGIGEYMRRCAPGAVLFIAVSVAGNLSWLFSFDAAYEKFRMLSQVTKVGISSRAPFEAGLAPLVKWFTLDVVRQEGPLGVMLVAGLVYAVVRRRRADLVVVSYVAVYLFALRDWSIRYLHLFVAMMPVLCILAARLTDELFGRYRVRRALAALFVCVVVLPSTIDSVRAAIVTSRQDTRLAARDWVEENVPPGTAIAMDWYEFSVPLLSPTPVNLVNPKAQSLFEERLPERLKRGYEEFLDQKKSYRLVPVVYSTDTPNWPDEMDPRARSLASGKEVYRELYSVFNFRTLEELEDLGAEYLVISSYGYTNFLLDDDPAKTEEAVFNYLFKEDLLSFNKQADEYIDDGRFGLLYWLNKRARDFYTPLLTESSTARAVKEFRPGAYTGPVIRIYRLRG